MLSYQHAYHAGSLVDVHKHSALAALLHHLKTKPKPISYIETHAGRAIYDLASPEAQKTGEAAAGITPLLASGRIPAKHPYARAIADTRARRGASAYPGSPEIARRILGVEDQLHFMELHPQEYAALRRWASAGNLHTHRRDGYEGALAISPPTPRRGLVFVDPSYEIKTEYAAVAEFVIELHRKWATATVVVWYPILEAGLHASMIETLQTANLPKCSRREVLFGERAKEHRIKGSGLFIVNEPHGVEAALAEAQDFVVS